MTRLFASSWDKLDRGKQHLDVLIPKLTTAYADESNVVTVDKGVAREGEIFVTVFTLDEFPQPPEDVGLIVGDVIHNYRGALDHLTWELVKRVGKMPTEPRLQRLIQFPLANSFASFKDGLNRRLPGVPKDYWAALKRYQPYRRGYEGQGMRLLRRLSDTDKHRVIVPTTTASASTELRLIEIDCSIVDYEWGVVAGVARRLNAGATIAEVVAVDDPGSIGAGEVEMEGHLMPYPSLGRHVDVEAALQFVGGLITQLLTEMEELF